MQPRRGGGEIPYRFRAVFANSPVRIRVTVDMSEVSRPNAYFVFSKRAASVSISRRKQCSGRPVLMDAVHSFKISEVGDPPFAEDHQSFRRHPVNFCVQNHCRSHIPTYFRLSIFQNLSSHCLFFSLFKRTQERGRAEGENFRIRLSRDLRLIRLQIQTRRFCGEFNMIFHSGLRAQQVLERPDE